jgi:hypothetical protein
VSNERTLRISRVRAAGQISKYLANLAGMWPLNVTRGDRVSPDASWNWLSSAGSNFLSYYRILAKSLLGQFHAQQHKGLDKFVQNVCVLQNATGVLSDDVQTNATTGQTNTKTLIQVACTTDEWLFEDDLHRDGNARSLGGGLIVEDSGSGGGGALFLLSYLFPRVVMAVGMEVGNTGVCQENFHQLVEDGNFSPDSNITFAFKKVNAANPSHQICAAQAEKTHGLRVVQFSFDAAFTPAEACARLLWTLFRSGVKVTTWLNKWNAYLHPVEGLGLSLFFNKKSLPMKLSIRKCTTTNDHQMFLLSRDPTKWLSPEFMRVISRETTTIATTTTTTTTTTPTTTTTTTPNPTPTTTTGSNWDDARLLRRRRNQQTVRLIVGLQESLGRDVRRTGYGVFSGRRNSH